MIRYTLKCSANHRFESWFQSADAYASLGAAGQLACPVCGDLRVEKDLMAPSVRQARQDRDRGKIPDATEGRVNLSEPASEIEAALAALRRQIEENSEYVGMNFTAEARKMHEGGAPKRSIYGEAQPDEARQMLEDGLPVAPLPFLPGRKAN
jgi:hypothetical protein